MGQEPQQYRGQLHLNQHLHMHLDQKHLRQDLHQLHGILHHQTRHQRLQHQIGQVELHLPCLEGLHLVGELRQQCQMAMLEDACHLRLKHLGDEE